MRSDVDFSLICDERPTAGAVRRLETVGHLRLEVVIAVVAMHAAGAAWVWISIAATSSILGSFNLGISWVVGGLLRRCGKLIGK
jgi:hypothetical protein